MIRPVATWSAAADFEKLFEVVELVVRESE
jgi:hypothetical protein